MYHNSPDGYTATRTGVTDASPPLARELEADDAPPRFTTDVRYPPQLSGESLRIVVLWTLAGAAGGIVAGMLFGRSGADYERVDLETSCPRLLAGVLIGMLLGVGMGTFYERKPGARFLLTIASIVVFCVSLGAMSGWLFGSMQRSRNCLQFEQVTRWGTVVGAVMGLLFGLRVGKTHAIVHGKQAGVLREKCASGVAEAPGGRLPGATRQDGADRPIPTTFSPPE